MPKLNFFTDTPVNFMAEEVALLNESSFISAIQSINATAEAIQNSILGPIQTMQAVAEACVRPMRIAQELAEVLAAPLRSMEYVAKLIADQQKMTQGLYESISWMFPQAKQGIEEKPVLKPLVSFQGDHVEVNGLEMYPKMNAVHVLTIRALTELSDENGICLNSQIENYLIEKGLAPLKGRQQRERIRTGIRDGMRFLGIPTFVENGDRFCKRIRNKGYLCKNMIST